MENTILELVEICRQKELYCMHDNVDDLIESALNSKLLSINSQCLDKKKQEVKNVVEQPAERRTQPEYLLSMGYEHPNTTSEMKSDEIIKSGVEKLVPIPNKCEVTSEDKREYDMPVCENSSICVDHYEIFSDDDDISSDDDDFEDIEYVEASLPDPEIVSVEEENVEEEVDLEDVFQIQEIILREKLLSINRLIANIESLNENPTPDYVLNSSVLIPIFEDPERLLNVVMNDISNNSTNDPLLEEVYLFIALDNSIPPGIVNFGYDSEGDICFLKELFIDDSIPFPNNESSESDFDNPSFPRPPPEPPDDEFDSEPEVISAAMKNIDKFSKDECFDPGREIDDFTNVEDDDYFPFIFVIRIFLPYLIYHEVSLLLLFVEKEDTIFDPGDWSTIYAIYSPRCPGFAGGEWGRVVGSSRLWWNGQEKTWSGVAGSGGNFGCIGVNSGRIQTGKEICFKLFTYLVPLVAWDLHCQSLLLGKF
nr:hypothetical protein [Tanacetum cinerariifolium]